MSGSRVHLLVPGGHGSEHFTNTVIGPSPNIHRV